MKPRIAVLNGPNLNLLGVRQPHIYGRDTLADITRRLEARAKALGVDVELRQSNSESKLVTWIHQARTRCAGIIINPAAFTHTSVAILDALLTCEFPVIELHLSNPHRREEFRHRSFVSGMAKGIICGFGAHGYELALDAMAKLVADAAGKESPGKDAVAKKSRKKRQLSAAAARPESAASSRRPRRPSPAPSGPPSPRTAPRR